MSEKASSTTTTKEPASKSTPVPIKKTAATTGSSTATNGNSKQTPHHSINLSEGELKQKSLLLDNDLLSQESEEGMYEYKWKLVNISEERLKHLISQLKYRLTEGQGEAIYEIGISDQGVPLGLDEAEFDESIETLRKMATSLSADVTIICEKYVNSSGSSNSTTTTISSLAIGSPSSVGSSNGSAGGNGSAALQGRKKVGEVLIRKFGDEQYMDLRIAVCGNVDSGKSTLIGVLTRGKLDNGRGLARMNVFQHKHEITTGRTSSISHQILGYNSKGDIVNYDLIGTPEWKEIIEKSSKVCTFIDLAGHEKYLKTTVFGMTGNVPDYSCVVIGSNMGVTRMTKEHIGLCLALKIPIFIVVTKIDICPENVLKETVATIHKILKLPGVRKIPYHIKNEDDVLTCSKNIAGDRITPIFFMSSVTGENIKLLRKFLNLIPVRRDWEQRVNQPAEFVIDQTFFVAGVGTVVSGIVSQGTLAVGDNLMLGPDGNGMFREVQVKSIHSKRVNVRRVQAGQQASLALKKEKRSAIRKGMVMVENKQVAKAIWEFEAEVVILYHSTTIKSNYQPVIHCMCVRQAARIISSNVELRTGDKSLVRFRFMFRPEFVKVGERLIFREGRTKGLGVITKVFTEIGQTDEEALVLDTNNTETTSAAAATSTSSSSSTTEGKAAEEEETPLQKAINDTKATAEEIDVEII